MLDVTMLCMEGKVIGDQITKREKDWQPVGNFGRELLLNRFCPTNKHNQYLRLMRLQQKTTVRECRR